MHRTGQIRQVGIGIQISVKAVPGAVQVVDISILIVDLVQAVASCQLDLLHLFPGKLHQGTGFDFHILVTGKELAVLRSHTAAGDAVFHGNMLAAGSLGTVLRIAGSIGNTVKTTGIALAGSGCDQTGIQAHAYGLENIAVKQSLAGKPLMDGLHDHPPQSGGGIRRVAGQIDLLWTVEAAPYSGGIMPRVTAEPAVLVGGGGAGLTGDVLSAENRCAAGAVVGSMIQAVVDIVNGLVAEHLLAVLGIIQNDPSVAVVDLGEESGLTIHTVIGKGCVSSCHFLHRCAHSKGAQRQGGLTDIGLDGSIGSNISVGQVA